MISDPGLAEDKGGDSTFTPYSVEAKEQSVSIGLRSSSGRRRVKAPALAWGVSKPRQYQGRQDVKQNHVNTVAALLASASQQLRRAGSPSAAGFSSRAGCTGQSYIVRSAVGGRRETVRTCLPSCFPLTVRLHVGSKRPSFGVT